jgi:hypothetical protein
LSIAADVCVLGDVTHGRVFKREGPHGKKKVQQQQHQQKEKTIK